MTMVMVCRSIWLIYIDIRLSTKQSTMSEIKKPSHIISEMFEQRRQCACEFNNQKKKNQRKMSSKLVCVDIQSINQLPTFIYVVVEIFRIFFFYYLSIDDFCLDDFIHYHFDSNGHSLS